MNARNALVIGGVASALAVVAGAFGAHALQDALPPRLMQAYRTAVEYHTVHSLGLLLLGLLMERRPGHPWLARAATLMFAGLWLFSGSLYLLALSGVRAFGLITPFGGVAFILAWLAMAFGSRLSVGTPPTHQSKP